MLGKGLDWSPTSVHAPFLGSCRGLSLWTILPSSLANNGSYVDLVELKSSVHCSELLVEFRFLEKELENE